MSKCGIENNQVANDGNEHRKSRAQRIAYWSKPGPNQSVGPKSHQFHPHVGRA